MATKAQLITRIRQLVQDMSVSDDTLLSFVNEGYAMIAAGMLMPDGGISPPLPDLLTSGSVAAVSTTYVKDLPATYLRDVVGVYSLANDGNLVRLDTFMQMQKKFPDMDEEGSITYFAIKGTKIYYQPSANDTLTVWYHQKTTDLSGDSDTPAALPAYLHYSLLANYVAREVFKILGNGDKAGFYDQEFFKAMAELVRYIGPVEAGPQNVPLDDDY